MAVTWIIIFILVFTIAGMMFLILWWITLPQGDHRVTALARLLHPTSFEPPQSTPTLEDQQQQEAEDLIQAVRNYFNGEGQDE